MPQLELSESLKERIGKIIDEEVNEPTGEDPDGIIDTGIDDDEYEPGHPWFYKTHKPLSVQEIIDLAKPIDELPRKARAEEHKQRLFEDIQGYNELLEQGIKALSDYDINICHDGDSASAYEQALALVHNHISYEASILKKFGINPNNLQRGGQ